jgi:hypothetical protein
VQVSPFTPPLSYNYLCGSTLLASYLPVYCYLYSIRILSLPLNTAFLAKYVPYTQLPRWARSRFSGIMWPDHWYATGRWKVQTVAAEGSVVTGNSDLLKERPTPRSLLTRDSMISKFVGDLLVLITFGLCCPLLGLAISISMTLNLLIHRGLIGRFLLAREDTSASSGPTISAPSPSAIPADLALLALNQSLLDLDSSYYRLIWVVLWSSCFFIAFICWDIAGDKMGALESIWLPCLAVLFVLSLQIFERYAHLVFLQESAETDRVTGISLESLPVSFASPPYHTSPTPGELGNHSR